MLGLKASLSAMATAAEAQGASLLVLYGSQTGGPPRHVTHVPGTARHSRHVHHMPHATRHARRWGVGSRHCALFHPSAGPRVPSSLAVASATPGPNRATRLPGSDSGPACALFTRTCSPGTGTAAEVAERVGRDARRHHVRARVLGMDEYDVRELINERVVVFVAVRHGAGGQRLRGRPGNSQCLGRQCLGQIIKYPRRAAAGRWDTPSRGEWRWRRRGCCVPCAPRPPSPPAKPRAASNRRPFVPAGSGNGGPRCRARQHAEILALSAPEKPAGGFAVQHGVLRVWARRLLVSKVQLLRQKTVRGVHMSLPHVLCTAASGLS